MNRPDRALIHFGFKQTLRIALIIGLLSGLMMGAQGATYAKAFPDAASRAKLVASLEAVPAVNFLSGEVKDATRPDSYALYKSLATLTVVTAAWGLLTTTRLLRSSEETGRQELLLAGSTTKRRVTASLLGGFGLSFLLAAVICFALTAALGASKDVQLSGQGALLMTAAVFLPGAFFAGLGVLTSQLAGRRGRALMYGFVPFALFYVVRGLANSVSRLDWLKGLSPFGWSDFLNPVLDPHVLWLLPPLIGTAMFAGLGIVIAGRRDYGLGLVSHSDAAKSRYYGLRTPFGFALREQSWSLIWWIFGTTAFAAFFAAIAGMSVGLLKDSSAFDKVIGTHSDDYFKVLFLGAGLTFIAIILLVMVSVYTHAIRSDEASGYLDNLLVRRVRRSTWLLGRLLLLTGALVFSTLLIGTVMWFVSRVGQVPIGFGRLLLTVVSLLGPIILTLGVGAFFYGIWPRLALTATVVVIAWGFIEGILSALFHLSDWVGKTSLLTYISTDPTKAPDWAGFTWLVCLGIFLAIFGIYRFTKRDIVAE